MFANCLRQCGTITRVACQQILKECEQIPQRSLWTSLARTLGGGTTTNQLAIAKDLRINASVPKRPEPVGNSPVFKRCMSQIKCLMEYHKIVPDVIPCAPKEFLYVKFSEGSDIKPGQELTPRQVRYQPQLTWEANPKHLYTVCMTDPDAPSRQEPRFREWHHWLVGNIEGDSIVNGDVLSAYIGAGPPEGTGLHRYVILIYKQPERICFRENILTNTSAEGRGNFRISSFAAKYHLGHPIAGNFFVAQWDDYVPELYKQLGA